MKELARGSMGMPVSRAWRAALILAFGILASCDRPRSEGEGTALEWRHRTIAVGQGDSLYLVHRRLDREHILVFIPGLADTWESYLALAAELPDTLGMVLVDPLGHGASTKRAGASGPGRQAEALSAALDSLGVRPFAVVGHSNGGIIAQFYGNATPGLPAAVLIASGSGFGTHPAADDFRALAASLPDTVPDEVLELQRDSFRGPVPDSIVQPYIDAARATPGRVWREVIDSLLAFDTRVFLTGWRPRTLLVLAEEDAVIGDDGMIELAAAMPDADTVRIPGTSHGVHWQRPDAVADAVMAFLATVE